MEFKDILTMTLSICAVTVSLISFYLSYRQRDAEGVRAVRKNLTETIAELVSVSKAFEEVAHNKELTTQYSTVMSRLYNAQRRYLADHAEFLIDKAEWVVTDIDFNVIACAYQAFGSYGKAGKYWEKCIAVSSDPNVKMQNLRGYAKFLFFQGATQAGRNKYQESLAIELQDTDNMRRMRADTYALWSITEIDFGDVAEGERLHNQAIAAAERIGHKRMREDILNRINIEFRDCVGANSKCTR